MNVEMEWGGSPTNLLAFQLLQVAVNAVHHVIDLGPGVAGDVLTERDFHAAVKRNVGVERGAERAHDVRTAIADAIREEVQVERAIKRVRRGTAHGRAVVVLP